MNGCDQDWDAPHAFVDVASSESTQPVCYCGRSRTHPLHGPDARHEHIWQDSGFASVEDCAVEGCRWTRSDGEVFPPRRGTSAAQRQFLLAVEEHRVTHPEPMPDCPTCSYTNTEGRGLSADDLPPPSSRYWSPPFSPSADEGRTPPEHECRVVARGSRVAVVCRCGWERVYVASVSFPTLVEASTTHVTAPASTPSRSTDDDTTCPGAFSDYDGQGCARGLCALCELDASVHEFDLPEGR